MPLDGNDHAVEPAHTPKRRWHCVVPAGQLRKRRRWHVETAIGGTWGPAFSLYADTKREANGIARWAMRMMFPDLS